MQLSTPERPTQFVLLQESYFQEKQYKVYTYTFILLLLLLKISLFFLSM